MALLAIVHKHEEGDGKRVKDKKGMDINLHQQMISLMVTCEPSLD